MRILTLQTWKLQHGSGLGVVGAVLYLQPALFDGRNNCAWSTAGCRAACFPSSGRMAMPKAAGARAWRTRLLREDPATFWREIRAGIRNLERRAAEARAVPCVRLDGTSDLDLAARVAAEFPGVRFVDYTKSERRMLEWLAAPRSNRWLTYSRSESNDAACERVLAAGGNVAAVFSTRKGEPLPKTWNGRRVIDGDSHDWRFLDQRRGRSLIVGLRAKGKARQDRTGFVIQLSQH